MEPTFRKAFASMEVDSFTQVLTNSIQNGS